MEAMILSSLSFAMCVTVPFRCAAGHKTVPDRIDRLRRAFYSAA